MVCFILIFSSEMSLVSIIWNKYKIWKVKQPLAQRFKAKPRATKPHPSRVLPGTWVRVFYILLSGKQTFVDLLLQLGTTESKQPLSESAHKQELNDHSSEIHPKRRRAQTSPLSSSSSFHMPRAMAELLRYGPASWWPTFSPPKAASAPQHSSWDLSDSLDAEEILD